MIAAERRLFTFTKIRQGQHVNGAYEKAVRSMSIPKSVKIGWKTYSIVEGERRAYESTDLLGEINYVNDEIWLYQGLTPGNKAVTLLHEILHGIFNHCGRQQNQCDEGLIIAVSENMYQLFRDNPQLLHIFLDDEPEAMELKQ